MILTEWSKLALICILGAMSPGPSLAVILRNSISGGRKQGIFAGIGHGLGITLYALIAVFGLITCCGLFLPIRYHEKPGRVHSHRLVDYQNNVLKPF